MNSAFSQCTAIEELDFSDARTTLAGLKKGDVGVKWPCAYFGRTSESALTERRSLFELATFEVYVIALVSCGLTTDDAVGVRRHA